ncbi:hypothetical protein LVD15_24830 [Fulvivirga maritima]|uniref:hypothetical protein n=1 Tax=Fulvivirga maritima TaxID=2904247 RepID=UPI001F19E7D3|nr:hypothetical protein [Fulvivirga maritima]UII26483.1 hypothetical protein LVD15_24830 [Fulvivirga maritima]
MELDELRKSWKAQTDEVKYSKKEVDEIFEVKTKRSLKTLNRNMLTDALLMALTTLAFISVSFLLGLKDRVWISAELITMALVLTLHYKIKYHLINQFDFEVNGVKSAMIKTIDKLKRYIKIYKIGIPCISTLLFITYLIRVNFYQHGVYFSSDLLTWKWALAPVCYLTTHLIVHVLAKWMYGKSISKMESDLKKLDSL